MKTNEDSIIYELYENDFGVRTFDDLQSAIDLMNKCRKFHPDYEYVLKKVTKEVLYSTTN